MKSIRSGVVRKGKGQKGEDKLRDKPKGPEGKRLFKGNFRGCLN